MNDQELATAVRQSVDWARMDVPEEQIMTRSRAIRAARRRRVAAGVTAVATAGAAAIAAALVLPGPVVPATQDTAYVVSRVTQALDAVPAGSILFLQTTTIPGAAVTEMWMAAGPTGTGSRTRTEVFASGRLTGESGSAITSEMTSVYISYRTRTWSRSVTRDGVPSAADEARAAAAVVSSACRNPGIGISANPSQTAAEFRALVACDRLKADGTASIGGGTAIRLTMPAMRGSTTTWYVSPATYLPIRMTTTWSGNHGEQYDFRWLPPTRANLAKLSLPTPPRGFTQVPMPARP